MPYIITARQPAYMRGTPTGFARESTRAVATLDEAREHLTDALGDDFQAPVPESGGTIGPLPDGTVIEVRLATYDELRGPAGLEGVELYGLRDERRDQIIDAFNSR